MKYFYRKAADGWRWRLKSSNGKIIAESGEAYQNKTDCLTAIGLVKSSKDAPVQEE